MFGFVNNSGRVHFFLLWLSCSVHSGFEAMKNTEEKGSLKQWPWLALQQDADTLQPASPHT